jgi:hypothetical protein
LELKIPVAFRHTFILQWDRGGIAAWFDAFAYFRPNSLFMQPVGETKGTYSASPSSIPQKEIGFYMKRTVIVYCMLIIGLVACSAPEAVLTQTNMPATFTPTLTPLPPVPTETAVPNPKLPAAPFDSETYINEEAGFAIDYPAGWTVNETVVGSRGTQIQFLSSPELAEASLIPANQVRLSATIYQWDPKNDLDAYVQHWKEAWSASGFTILEEQDLILELGLPAVQFTVQSPDTQTVFLVTALEDQYLVIAGEGDLELAKQIVQRLRPVTR